MLSAEKASAFASACGSSSSRMAAWWYGKPMCSAQYFADSRTGIPADRAPSIIFWSSPFVCSSISSLRPERGTPSKIVLQNA